MEKFDNKRLRFKRPISARAGDSALIIDPYRSQYGISDAAVILLIVVGTVAVLVLLLAVIHVVL